MIFICTAWVHIIVCTPRYRSQLVTVSIVSVLCNVGHVKCTDLFCQVLSPGGHRSWSHEKKFATTRLISAFIKSVILKWLVTTLFNYSVFDTIKVLLETLCLVLIKPYNVLNITKCNEDDKKFIEAASHKARETGFSFYFCAAWLGIFSWVPSPQYGDLCISRVIL